MRTSFEALWADWKGQILLCNIANQVISGIIDPSDLRPLYRAARDRKSDFITRNALMDAGFPVTGPAGSGRNDGLHFISTKGPNSDSLRLYLRVQRMTQILSCVSFDDLDGDDHDGIVSKANDCTVPARTPQEEALRQEALKNVQAGLFDANVSAKIASEWGLSSAFAGWQLRRANLRRNGVGPRNSSDDPVFMAPIAVTDGIEDLFRHAKTSITPADIFRDRLGLDHLSSPFISPKVSRPPSHAILGFILVREHQFQTGTPKRPSPFDDTSHARFRAVHGPFSGRVTSTGRTADLASISVGGSIVGVPEVVAKNRTLIDGNVLIGYIGEIKDPRKDAYIDRVATANTLDQTFMNACMGSWVKDDIITALIDACPEVL